MVIYKPDAKYTPQAGHDRIEGVVKIWIVIDTQGNVTNAQESSSPLGDGLDENAIAAVKKWRFSPATRNGVPVAVRVEVAINFGPRDADRLFRAASAMDGSVCRAVRRFVRCPKSVSMKDMATSGSHTAATTTQKVRGTHP